jgi:hypothetical protein
LSTTPNLTDGRRLRGTKAFQRLWVAGTLGAFFSALARNFPVDVRQLVYSFTAEFALRAALRYAYLLWLIWYFFLSNMRSQADDPPTPREIAYDVLQSIFGLGAAFYLDFLVANEHHSIRAYMAPNISIFVICVLAFVWFGKGSTELQTARGVGAAVAGVSAIGTWFIPTDPWWVVGVLLIPLTVLLWPIAQFHRLRLAGDTRKGTHRMR